MYVVQLLEPFITAARFLAIGLGLIEICHMLAVLWFSDRKILNGLKKQNPNVCVCGMNLDAAIRKTKRTIGFHVFGIVWGFIMIMLPLLPIPVYAAIGGYLVLCTALTVISMIGHGNLDLFWGVVETKMLLRSFR